MPALDPAFAELEEGATRIAKGADGTEIVPADMSYFEWLKTQPPEFQDAAIGPRRGELLRNGGLSATRFGELQLDRNFQPRTLAQIREAEPLAFENAENARDAENNLTSGGESGILQEEGGVPVTEYKPLALKQIESLQRHSDEVWGALTERERGSLKSYTAAGFRDINDSLRDGTWMNDPGRVAMIERIDAAIGKFGATEGMTVFRGELNGNHYAGWKIGAVESFDAYTSTTVQEGGASYFAERPFQMEINLPQGRRGFYVGGQSDFPGEFEFLLARGTKVRVLENSKNFMRLEVVDE